MFAFLPIPESTANITVGAASARVAVPARAGGSIRIMNNGTATVWVNFGDGTVTASMTTGMPIGPGSVEVVEAPEITGTLNAAAIAAAATGIVYFTPGEGM